MPDRMGPLRKLPVRFTARVNGGVVSDGAIVVDGGDLGIGELALPGLGGLGPVPGERATILAPAGIREGDGVEPRDILVLIPVAAGETDEVAVEGGRFFEGPVGAFLPGTDWQTAGETGPPSDRWWPKRYDPGSAPSAESPVLIALGDEEPGSVFGTADTGNNPFLTGNNPFLTGNNPFLTGNNPFLVAAPASVVEFEGDGWEMADVFDAGWPAPLGGATFGLSVLSTPDASIAGQSANPLVDLDTDELLQREEAQGMLAQAGITDADDLEWLAGPTRIADVEGPTTVSLLGEETELESYTAVVAGGQNPWWVGLTAARATPDDHVIALGMQRAPIGTGRRAAKNGDTTLFVRGLAAGRRYMSAVVEGLSAA